VNRTARIEHGKCPKNQKEEIKIEINVVYQERSVCVSEKTEKKIESLNKSCWKYPAAGN
jgi:hypothetical protein